MCQVSLVRRHHYIVERQQPSQHIVGQHLAGQILEEHTRFFFVNVQAGRANLAGFQTVDQRPGIDQGAATGVDQHHALFHFLDGRFVDHVMRLGEQRHMERDDVRLAQQPVHVDVLYAVARGDLLVRKLVESQNATTKTQQDINDALPDLSGAGHADGLAVHVKPGQAFQHEVTRPNALVGLVELPVEHQHKAHSVLRHGIGRVSRHASDAEVVLLARPQVNVVETGAT